MNRRQFLAASGVGAATAGLTPPGFEPREYRVFMWGERGWHGCSRVVAETRAEAAKLASRPAHMGRIWRIAVA